MGEWFVRGRWVARGVKRWCRDGDFCMTLTEDIEHDAFVRTYRMGNTGRTLMELVDFSQ